MSGEEKFTKWRPEEVARHYGFPEGLTGKGQTVAIIDLGEIVDADELREDLEALGVENPHVEIIDTGGAPVEGLPPGAIETHIDVEIVASICPDARIKVYRCAFDFKALAAGIRSAVQGGADIVSVSWGASEDALGSGVIAAVEAALAEAREAGVTVCAAAGDFGASGTVDPETHLPVPAADGKPHCIYPASSPQVLSCGGTEVHETPSGDRHEAVWNRIAHKGRATGGGVSRLFPPPPWQAGLEVPSAAGRNARPGRVLPDVAAVAAVRDWSFVIEHGKTVLEGGTSCAAPLYAALVAQANELRARSGLPRLGFVNARLYEAARSGGLFIDVTEGDNRNASDAPGYAARKGFDACTGWGAPRADALAKALAAAP